MDLYLTVSQWRPQNKKIKSTENETDGVRSCGREGDRGENDCLQMNKKDGWILIKCQNVKKVGEGDTAKDQDGNFDFITVLVCFVLPYTENYKTLLLQS